MFYHVISKDNYKSLRRFSDEREQNIPHVSLKIRTPITNLMSNNSCDIN